MLVGHGFALEEHRERQAQLWRCRRDDSVDVALDPATRHREPELAAVSLLVVQFKSRHAQPAHGQVFQHMADLEHPQDATRETPAGINWRTGVLVLQRTFTGHAQTGSTKVVTRGLPGTFNIQRHIDEAR